MFQRFTATSLIVPIVSAMILRPAPFAAAAQWAVTNSQFERQTVDVSSIGADGLRLAGGDTTQPSILKWDDLLEISRHPTAPAGAGKFIIYLTAGDHLLGSPSAVSDEKLGWNLAGVGSLDLPLEKLAAITKSAAPMPADLDQNRTDDIVRLANGDQAHGIITQIGDTGVTIQTAAATPTLPWDAVAAVLFSTPPHFASADARSFRIRLVDGSSLTAASLTLEGTIVHFSLDGKNTHELPVAMVTTIEQVNGPVSWLTSRRPSENIYKPWFSENFPTRFDRTVDDGKPIAEKYPAFHHGIGCHSYSRLSYDLDGTYSLFRAQYALDSESPLADVTVRVLLDDKVAVEKKNVKIGPVYPVISVPLAGAKKLSLEVDYGENYATEDRFVWLDPALVRAKIAKDN